MADYFLKTAVGGVKQICQSVANRPGEYVVLASFAIGPQQRHLVACVNEGFLSAGDKLHRLPGGRHKVGVVIPADVLDAVEMALREGYANCGEEPDCVYAEPLAKLRQWREKEGR